VRAAAAASRPVLVLTVSRSADDLFDALRAGAAGYLLKDMDPEDLVTAVRGALAGEAVLPGFLAARLIDEFRNRGRGMSLTLDQNRRVELTPREWDVLELFGDGLSTARSPAGSTSRRSPSGATCRPCCTSSRSPHARRPAG
jgi:DNA-binding NarL/FixJ family response regulator